MNLIDDIHYSDFSFVGSVHYDKFKFRTAMKNNTYRVISANLTTSYSSQFVKHENRVVML